MKRSWLALGLIPLGLTYLATTGCSRQDQDFARDKAKQAGQELRKDARQASREIQHGAEELDRKAGPKLDQAGRELKQDAQHASDQLKGAANRLRQDTRHDEPPRSQ